MSDLLPRLTVGVDLLGFALTLWLGLYGLAHGWGWQRVRRNVVLALWGLALVFALGVYDWLAPLTGASSTLAVVRLLLLPFPLGWFMLARRLAPGVVLAHSRAATVLVLVVTLATAAVSVLTGIVVPEWLPRSWLYLPAYLLTLVLAMGATVSLALSARATTAGALERRAMAALVAGSWLALVGGALLATDWVLGLGNALLPDFVARLAEPLRLLGSASLLTASGALAVTLRTQARAEGAHLLNFAQSLTVTLVLVVVFLAIGGAAVWYWQLPPFLVALFLVLALLTEWLVTVTRATIARMSRRKPTGKLRQELLAVAERLDEPEEVPPAVRPLLNRLARQLHSPQLGLAIRDDKGFRVVAALRPSWEGATIDVPHPDVWEERAVGGWNKPVKLNGQTIGVIASETTGPLNPVQVRLLDQAAMEIVQLISDWREAAKKREALQKALEEYQQHTNALHGRSVALASPVAVGGFGRGVQQVLQQYKDTSAVGRHSLATLKLVETSAGPLGGKSIEGRGQVLQQTLASLIEQLRPLEGEPPTMPTPEWHPYLILRWAYLQGIPPEEVMTRLYLKPGAYHRAHRAAISTVARMLAELEAGVLRTLSKKETAGSTTLPAPGTAGSTTRPALASPNPSLPSASPSLPLATTTSSPTPPSQTAPTTQPPTPASTKGSSLRDFANRVRRPEAAKSESTSTPSARSSEQADAKPTPPEGATRRLPAFAKGTLAARFAGTANRWGAAGKDAPKGATTESNPAAPPASSTTASPTNPPPAPPPLDPITTMPLHPPSQASDAPARTFTRPVPKPSEKEGEEKKPEEGATSSEEWDAT